MRFNELPAWAKIDVLKAVKRTFPELKENPEQLNAYLDSKDDFQIIDANEGEEDMEPEYVVIW